MQDGGGGQSAQRRRVALAADSSSSFYALAGGDDLFPPSIEAGQPTPTLNATMVETVAWLASASAPAGADGVRPSVAAGSNALPSSVAIDGTPCDLMHSVGQCSAGSVEGCVAWFCCGAVEEEALAPAAAAPAASLLPPPLPPPLRAASSTPTNKHRVISIGVAAGAASLAFVGLLAGLDAAARRRAQAAAAARAARAARASAALATALKTCPDAAVASSSEIQPALTGSADVAARRASPPRGGSLPRVPAPTTLLARANSLPTPGHFIASTARTLSPYTPWTPASARAAAAAIAPPSFFEATATSTATALPPFTSPPAGSAPLGRLVLDVDPADLTLGLPLGAGSFGVVHEATWRGAACAVKRLIGADAASLASLAAEVAVLAGRRHPRLVTLLGACLDPSRGACLVVELVPGGSLAARLASIPPSRVGPGGGLFYASTLRLGADVAAGMAALHPTVVHRDVKPSNVLCAPGGRYKLCDFGVARVKAAAGGGGGEGTATTAGAAAGTAPFMSPEQFGGARVTGAADVWALGCVLAHAWSGVPPWEGCTNLEICYSVGVRALPPPQARGVEGRAPPPPFLARMLVACFARDPAARPTAADLASSLEAELGKVALAAARAARGKREEEA